MTVFESVRQAGSGDAAGVEDSAIASSVQTEAPAAARCVSVTVPGWASGAVAAAVIELERAIAKYPVWPEDPLHALTIVTEEHGELAQKLLQRAYEPDKRVTDAQVFEEARQLAAMALRMLAHLEVAKYRQSPQVGLCG